MRTSLGELRRGRLGRGGFSLIELLVVVSILALLFSMLVPSLGRAKGLAREMLCKSNLSGIGKAAEMYASDNGGYVPRDFWYGCNNPNAGHEYGHYFFAGKFAQYVGGRKVPFQYDDNDPYLVKVFQEIPLYKCPCVLQA